MSFSTRQSHGIGSTEKSARKSNSDTSGTSVSHTTVVHNASSNDLQITISVTKTRTVSNTSKQGEKASTQKNEIGCFQSVRAILLEQGISTEAVAIGIGIGIVYVLPSLAQLVLTHE